MKYFLMWVVALLTVGCMLRISIEDVSGNKSKEPKKENASVIDEISSEVAQVAHE